jgi:hypothetical protein
MTPGSPISVAGDSPEDQRLWHTYFHWPRAVLSPASRLSARPEFRRLSKARSGHLQAILFAAFALEYRVKRLYDVLKLRYREKDTLGALLGNFRRRLETSDRLDGQGPVRLPAEWARIERGLKELSWLRNQIAHANYKKVLSLLSTNARQSRAMARRCFNTLVDAIRVTNRAIGYETLAPREARRYYSRLKLR